MSDVSPAPPAPQYLSRYLRWQMDMGGDEVVLDRPLLRATAHRDVAAPAPGAIDPAARSGPEAARQDGARATGLAASAWPASGAGKLGESAPAPAPRRRDPQVPRPVARPELPEFEAMRDFQKHLAENYPALVREFLPGSQGEVLPGSGPEEADLAVFMLEPSPEAPRGDLLTAPEAGLLEKMLRAIRFDPGRIYLSSVIKTRPDAGRVSRRFLVRHLPWLMAELRLVRAPMVLLLGEPCARLVLKTGGTLDDMRRLVHRFDGRPCAVTCHPAELLARPEVKYQAWEDLKWLRRSWQEERAPS